MTAHTIASKFRRALRKGTGCSLTAEEVRFLYDIGALEVLGIWKARSAARVPVALPWPEHEVVYFIGPIDGPVKIGYASDLRNRMRHLRFMSPSPLHIWAYVRGTMADEKAYHERFKSARVHGEWFDRVPEVEDEIVQLRSVVEMA